jgi:hypothetical protein
MRRLLSMLTLALALAAGIISPAASASASPTPGAGSFGVRLFDIPDGDAHNFRSMEYITDFLHPGSVISRRILAVNKEARTVRFTVYPDAAQITKGHFVGETGETRSELTTWIHVQHRVLVLRPGQKALDRITIRVPKVATRGEHYGVIWVQQSSVLRRTNGSQIREVARVGVRIYLGIGRGGALPTQFRITALRGSATPAGRPAVVAHVTNTGGLAVDLGGTAVLSGGPGGATVGTVHEKQVLTLAPGQSGNVIFPEHKGLPDGPWHARVALVSGFTHASIASSVDFSGHPPGPGFLPWVLWVPGLILGLLVLGLALLRYGPLAQRRSQQPRAGGAGRRAILPRRAGKQEA